MKIYITGCSGFLGSYLFKHLSKKFAVKKINLRKMPNKNEKNFIKFLDKITDAKVIINCAASLYPKTPRDFFINQDFPYLLQERIIKKKNKSSLIHISSLNVLIKDRQDPYAVSKKIAEKKLSRKNVVILRLPLLYNEINGVLQKEGNLKKVYDYLNFKFLPIYPMLHPGHQHQPLKINKLLIFIENLILKRKKNNKIYNLVGKNRKYIWDFFYEIALYKRKKVLKINTKHINKLMPNFIKENIKKKQNFFQQLLVIDHSKFNERKTFL